MNDTEIIKQVIYTEDGEKMNYIDIEKSECKNFIGAIENLIARVTYYEKIIVDKAVNNEYKKMWEETTNLARKLEIRNKELEENIKIATAMLTKGTYPEQNEGDNDFYKQFIPKSKIKERMKNVSDYKYEIDDDIHDYKKAQFETYQELLEEGE